MSTRVRSSILTCFLAVTRLQVNNMEGGELIRIVTKDDEECFVLTKLKAAGKEGFDLTVCHDGMVWTGQGRANLKYFVFRDKT